MTKTLIPLTNIIERDSDYLLTAELPGVSKDTLSVDVEKDVLKISGELAWHKEEKWKAVHREFFDDYRFEREFKIGRSIDKEKISAKIENGVLELLLPKSEESKPRKIEIA